MSEGLFQSNAESGYYQTILQEYYTGLIQYFIQNIYSTTHWILYPSMESILCKRHRSVRKDSAPGATKLVPHLSNLPYKERIRILNLYSLYCRRQRGDLIETFKILKQYLNINSTKFFTLSTSDLRGHDYKLFKPRSHLLIRSKFFTHRIIDLWNSLPPHVINSQSVDAFKNNLDDYWTETGYRHNERPMAYWFTLIFIVLLSIIIITCTCSYN